MVKSQGISSVEIAVQILEIIAKHEGPMRAVDIAKTIGFSKSRLHKYLISLCRSGMLQQDSETSLYRMGHKLIALAEAAQRDNPVLMRVNQELSRFTEQCNFSSGLVVRRGDFVQLVQYNRSQKNVDIDFRDDRPLPLSACVTGKVFLAYEERKETHALDVVCQEVREQGYVIRSAEKQGAPGAKTIACPVFDQDRKVVGAAFLIGFLPCEPDENRSLALRLLEAVRRASVTEG